MGLATQNNLTFTSKSMTHLLNPTQGVINLLSLVSGFIKAGISGVRKKFAEEDFIPVEYIKLKDLKVDKKYQRLVNLNFLKKAKRFRPELVKPLSVFQRPNGDLYIVDGQHTACLAALYVKDAENFELPCQVQEHDVTLSLKECEEAEATYFKELNFLRSNVGTIEKLRADIARGVQSALTMLSNLEALEIHIEGIGDENGDELFGYEKLKRSIEKYGNSYTNRAISLCKFHNKRKECTTWNKPLDGSMVLGLAAIYHFTDNYIGKGEKSKGFNEYLDKMLTIKTVSEWKYKTAGVIQEELIAERIVRHYNDAIGFSAVDAPKIGVDEDGSVFKNWLDDDIHKPKEKN